MKKKISLVFMFAIVVLITGCGEKKMVCTNQQSFGATVLDTKTIVKFKNDKVKKIETTMEVEFQDEATAESFAENYKDDEEVTVKVDGTKVIVKSEEDGESGKTQMTKDEAKESLEGRGYTCK